MRVERIIEKNSTIRLLYVIFKEFIFEFLQAFLLSKSEQQLFAMNFVDIKLKFSVLCIVLFIQTSQKVILLF